MNESEKKPFFEIVSAILQIYGKESNAGTLGIWWTVLRDWPFDAVKGALESFVREGGNPIPASIVKLLPDLLGHPAPEDAWNAAQKDEMTEGAYMSHEMLCAVIAASDSIERDDYIAARKCFLEVYQEKVQEARRNKRKAGFRYFPPIGQRYEDPIQIEANATQEALARGWIDQELAEQSLMRLEQLSGANQRLSATTNKQGFARIGSTLKHLGGSNLIRHKGNTKKD